MDFSVDKKKVSEGDIVEINWSCPQAPNATITLDSGFKSSSMEVENKGSKKFRLNRSNGSTTITVTAVVDGKTVTKSEKIRVNPSKERIAEEKRQAKEAQLREKEARRQAKEAQLREKEARRQAKEARRQHGGSFRKRSSESSSDGKRYDSYENLSSHPFREKLRTWKSQLSYSWKALPPQKKQAYIVVLAICAIMIGASFYPPITYFGLCAISFYLLWTLMRR